MTSQWVMALLGTPVHYDITVDNDVTMDILCHVTMSNDVSICKYHGITMHNDVSMNLFYCLLQCVFMLLYYG